MTSAWLKAVGLEPLTLIAGFCGAVISLKFLAVLTIWQKVTTVAAGTIVAAYCTPLTVEILNLSPKLEAAIAFLGGLFGMSIAGAAITAIPEWVAAAKEKWLSK